MDTLKAHITVLEWAEYHRGSLGIQGVDVLCTGNPCGCPGAGRHKTNPYSTNLPTKSPRPIIAVNEAWRCFGRENELKPLDFTGFVAVICSIRHFWFTIVTLPSEVDYG